MFALYLQGGGVYIDSGTMTFAHLQSGGVYIDNSGTVTLSSCTITGNTASSVRAHAQKFPSPRWENC